MSLLLEALKKAAAEKKQRQPQQESPLPVQMASQDTSPSPSKANPTPQSEDSQIQTLSLGLSGLDNDSPRTPTTPPSDEGIQHLSLTDFTASTPASSPTPIPGLTPNPAQTPEPHKITWEDEAPDGNSPESSSALLAELDGLQDQLQLTTTSPQAITTPEQRDKAAEDQQALAFNLALPQQTEAPLEQSTPVEIKLSGLALSLDKVEPSAAPSRSLDDIEAQEASQPTPMAPPTTPKATTKPITKAEETAQNITRPGEKSTANSSTAPLPEAPAATPHTDSEPHEASQTDTKTTAVKDDKPTTGQTLAREQTARFLTSPHKKSALGKHSLIAATILSISLVLAYLGMDFYLTEQDHYQQDLRIYAQNSTLNPARQLAQDLQDQPAQTPDNAKTDTPTEATPADLTPEGQMPTSPTANTAPTEDRLADTSTIHQTQPPLTDAQLCLKAGDQESCIAVSQALKLTQKPRNKPQASPAVTKATPPKKTPAEVKRTPIQTSQAQPLEWQAYEAFQQGDMVKAQQLYQQLGTQKGFERDAQLGLAAVDMAQGRAEAALNRYESLAEKYPQDEEVATALGTSLLSTQADSNRLSRLKALQQQTPHIPYLAFSLGNYYAQQGDWHQAQGYYAKAIGVEEGRSDYWLNYAVCLDHLQLLPQAQTAYERALATSGKNVTFDRDQVYRRIQLLRQQNQERQR